MTDEMVAVERDPVAMQGYPDQYWHIMVLVPKKHRPNFDEQIFGFDLHFDHLKQLIQCWRSDAPFLVGATTVQPSVVRGIKLIHTDEDRAHVAGQSRDSLSPSFAVFDKGKDYAQELFYSVHTAGATTTITESREIDLLLQVCKRIKHAAKILEYRRKDKQPYTITDEYDVQDLLQSALRAYFKYSVQENPLPKLGGISSRADMSIEELNAIIEIKYVHGPTDQERVVKEFAQDQQSYTQWEHLKHFVYVVYHSDDLKDPEALLKLAGPKNISGREFEAHVVLA
jgi:REase_DpnII-MboI